MEMQPHYMNGSSQGISTVFYINGDDKFPGKKVLFNLKRNRNFTSCLDHLTDSLKPPFGAVRNIFTPEGGHRVDRFQEINPEGKYVAAGKAGFRKYRYTDIEKSPRRRPPKNFLDLPPKNRKYQDVHGKIHQTNIQAVKIFVWPNRETINRPDPITLLPFQLDTMDAVINQVDERLRGKCGGCIARLYSRHGIHINDPKMLRAEECYVACRHHDRFCPVSYKDRQMPNFMTSPHIEKWRELPPLNSSRGSKNGKQWSPDHSGHSSYPNSENSYSHRHRKNQYNRQSREQREDDVVPRKPIAHKRSSERKQQEVNYDRDDGVFRSKGQNRHTQGAREIRDSRQTRVDLPIDQVEPEVVKDEDLDNYESRDDKTAPVPSGVELTKLPSEQNSEDVKDEDEDEDEEERIRRKPNSDNNSNNNRTPPKNKSKGQK